MYILPATVNIQQLFRQKSDINFTVNLQFVLIQHRAELKLVWVVDSTLTMYATVTDHCKINSDKKPTRPTSIFTKYTFRQHTGGDIYF